MVTLEQVEKLREHANISYDEARAALEETNGDILEAIINLERQNRIEAPRGGYYNSRNTQQDRETNCLGENTSGEYREDNCIYFKELVGKFIGWCKKIIGKGNRNNFEVRKGQSKVMAIPVTVLVVLIAFMFWVTIPIMVIGLFFGYRYAFS